MRSNFKKEKHSARFSKNIAITYIRQLLHSQNKKKTRFTMFCLDQYPQKASLTNRIPHYGHTSNLNLQAQYDREKYV